MVNTVKKTTNKFIQGLVLDFSPENTSNEVLTHALNATLVTFNGNELSLQNDMGNARVETAYLPEGYIPVGTCEYGGIIYIVSYNPLENKSLIGCFPSPERNVSSDELGELTDSITNDEFINSDYSIKNTSKLIILKRDPLNPGDKYIITANDEIYQENLYNLYTNNGNGFELLDNPFIALNIVSIEDSGKITYLDSDVVMYENGKYKYHILGSDLDSGNSKNDIDSYRTITSSGYNVFKSKISGKLAILAELIMVDSYSVTHKIEATSNPNEYDIILDIETSSEDTYQKYNIVPLLSYYYLEQSQGYIPFLGTPELDEELDVVGEETLRKMFDVNGDTAVFDNTLLSDIGYKKFTTEKLSNVIKTHNFPKPSTYHVENKMFCKAGSFYRFIKNHVMDVNGDLYEDFSDETFYRYIENLNEFQPIIPMWIKFQKGDQIIFIKPTSDLEISYIETYKDDCGIINPIIANNGSEGSVSTIKSLTLTNTLKDNIRLYNKLHFANIELDFSNVNSIPFKYEYKIVPCMRYGKLNHLAVSNSINFEHINDFNQSKFNTWKYRVDGDQLRLTVGAEVYDTNAADGNVVGIVLEFYDYRGFAGSLIFQNRNSYSGEFTKLITLNALGALSTQKLEINGNDGHFVTDYQRHISIQKNDDDTGMLDGKKVEWDANKGWRYENDKDLELNDCSTLYPNLVYGVIPYFLQKGSNDDYVVSKKDLMFLFTSTILNEHYYTCRNFNLLHDHKLDIILTYKINDQSSIEPYENALLPDYDPNALSQYLGGNYSELELHIKKYLYYVGKSKLQLEIGLKEDYKNIGLYNSPDINEYFTCTLLLMNDKGEVGYDIKSNDPNLQTAEEIIGYNPELQKYKNFNYIHFPGHSPSNPITEYNIVNFALYNFISNPSNTESIEIPYCFTVGHQVDITDIKDTRIPATTVCALCHKRDDGTYNYDDFGIYEVDTGDNTYYLANTIVYNAGDSETERLGIYKLIGVQDQLSSQCESLYLTLGKAVQRKRAGNLGSGNNLRSLVNSIGKLSFCLPHAHGSLDSEEGWPNIYNQILTVNDPYAVATTLNLGRDIDPNFSYKKDDIANGIYPVRSYYYAPRYNSCLLTQSCVDHLNEFISTMDINVLDSGKTILFDGKGGSDYFADPIDDDTEIAALTQCSEFIGFSGGQLATYNKKLLLTMKMVYAYNPDYDYLTIKAGNVNIRDTQCKFTSHLLSKSAVLNIASLTDYLYFGQYPVSKYLKEMEVYSDVEVLDSDNTWVPQLNFKEDLTYCGESNPALLTTLTYNIPKPESIYNELAYAHNDEVIVRKQDGSISRVKGELNKYALYGYHNDSLVLLDVNNYTISNDGSLTVKTKPTSDVNSDMMLELFLTKGITDTYNNTHSMLTDIPYKIIDNSVYLLLDCSDITDDVFSKVSFIVNNEYALEVGFSLKIKEVPKTVSINNLNSALIQLLFNKSYNNGILLDIRNINDNTVQSISLNSGSGAVTKSFSGSGLLEFTAVYRDEGGFLGYVDDYLILICIYNIYIDRNKNFINPYYAITKPINNVPITSNYSHFEKDYGEDESDALYYRISLNYSNSCICGTSITLNDLQYIPNPTGHRLYMKPNLVKYDTSLNNKIYYRYAKDNVEGSAFGGVKTADCTYKTTKDLNCLYLFTGPCFKPDTL